MERTTLVTTAEVVMVLNNGTADVLHGPAASNAYYFAEGRSGNDTIATFSARDSLLVEHKLFDGNGDGVIGLGTNGLLDIDRISKSKAGQDKIGLTGLSQQGLRYLGTVDGVSAYADAATKKAGWIEGTIGNDELDAARFVARTFFYDTALGLDLGNDVIHNWTMEDRLITTSPLVKWLDEGDTVAEYADEIGEMAGFDLATEDDTANNGIWSFARDKDGAPVGTTILIEAVTEAMMLKLEDTFVENGTTYYVYWGYSVASG